MVQLVLFANLLLGFFFLDIFSSEASTKPSPFLTRYKNVFYGISIFLLITRAISVILGGALVVSNAVSESVSGTLLVLEILFTAIILIAVEIRCRQVALDGDFKTLLRWIQAIVICIATCSLIFLVVSLAVTELTVYYSTYDVPILYWYLSPLLLLLPSGFRTYKLHVGIKQKPGSSDVTQQATASGGVDESGKVSQY